MNFSMLLWAMWLVHHKCNSFSCVNGLLCHSKCLVTGLGCNTLLHRSAVLLTKEALVTLPMFAFVRLARTSTASSARRRRSTLCQTLAASVNRSTPRTTSGRRRLARSLPLRRGSRISPAASRCSVCPRRHPITTRRRRYSPCSASTR